MIQKKRESFKINKQKVWKMNTVLKGQVYVFLKKKKTVATIK